ncbi:MAG: mannonate dehydratase [Bryobacteraceae bacterium]
MISRRVLLSAALGASRTLAPARAAALEGGIKLTMPGRDLSPATLRFIAHLGVEWVTAGGPGAPTYSPEGRVIASPGNTYQPPWKEEDLRRLKQRVEAAGLKIGNLMLHDFRDAILGRPGAGADIEKVQESIRVAGKVGIPVVEYNWYPLRAMGGYYKEPGRGGARMAAHDYDRSRNLPVLPDVGEHSAADLWKRYERFLKAVVPVAEKAGVRLAVHPNDPPPPRYRGTDQILGSVDGLKRACETVKSPANGITLDTGVTREMGFPVIETIQWFGSRDQINHVHFRNVIMKVPRQKYVETFIDAGDNDMMACLRALHETGYPRLLHPDHVPENPDDPAGYGGWGYAVGQVKAMLRAL